MPRSLNCPAKTHARLLLTACGISSSLLSTPPPLGAVTFKVGDDPKFASAILIEDETGSVLFQHDADARRSPASTQKLLLQLVVMDAVADGRYSLSDSVLTSAWASRIGGSQVYLRHGEIFTLGEMMEAIVIQSANDACVAVAEHLGGSVDGFVDLMNSKAELLGLENTRCVNVHGLDDTPRASGNFSSARDLTMIARAAVDHERIVAWSSVRYTTFRNGEFDLYNRNKLLGRFQGLDGLKTGYTERAGYCLVATARRGDMRLISAMMGCPNEKTRDRESARLLSWGFNHFSKVGLVRAGEPLGHVALEWGVEPEATAVTSDSVIAVLTTRQRQLLTRSVELPAEHPAPIEKGQKLGLLKVSIGDSILAQVDLVAEKAVTRMSLWEMVLSYF